MTLEQLTKLKSIFSTDILINEDNVLKKSIDMPSIAAKYLKLYVSELSTLKQMEIQKEHLYSKLYDKFKFHFSYKLDTIKEIDTYVKSDDSYYQTCLDVSNQEVVVDFLIKAVDVINKSGYIIKNYVDLLKIKNGIF